MIKQVEPPRNLLKRKTMNYSLHSEMTDNSKTKIISVINLFIPIKFVQSSTNC